MKERSRLEAIALGVAGAAVVGYGAAIGRDAWKATKKGSFVLIVLALVAGTFAMPFLGARTLTRGYPKSEHTPILKGLLLIAGGLVAGLMLFAIVRLYVPGDRSDLLFVLGMVAASVCLGLLYGASQKSARLRIFSIAEQNEAFLEQLGFEELDGTEVTHVDGDGNPLRLTEHNSERIVFMAVGRRNLRAYIRLSPEGQMLTYSGVIPITEFR
jgi:hypothetical protein